MVNSRLQDPGFKMRDRDFSVFINSEPETLLLKFPSPEALSAKDLQWCKSLKLTKMAENVNES